MSFKQRAERGRWRKGNAYRRKLRRWGYFLFGWSGEPMQRHVATAGYLKKLCGSVYSVDGHGTYRLVSVDPHGVQS